MMEEPVKDRSVPIFSQSSKSKTDCGPAERWQHSGRMLELTDRAGGLACRATEENSLDILLYRQVLSQRMHRAALRLHADFIAADMQPHVSGSYNAAAVAVPFCSNWHERTDAQEAAYGRWRKAVQALGPMFNDVVVSVACYDLMPDENHIPLLQVGLVVLSKWYEPEVGVKRQCR